MWSTGSNRQPLDGETVLLGSLTFGYPFLVRLGAALGRPRVIAILMGLVLLAPIASALQRGRGRDALGNLAGVVLAIVYLAVAALVNDTRLYRLGPALTNLALLLVFGRTVLKGPSIAETFARMRRRDLPCDAVRYCRRLTFSWCAFFAANSAVIAWMALYASFTAWTIYTGVIAYVLAGALFLAELIYRQWRFAHVAR